MIALKLRSPTPPWIFFMSIGQTWGFYMHCKWYWWWLWWRWWQKWSKPASLLGLEASPGLLASSRQCFQASFASPGRGHDDDDDDDDGDGEPVYCHCSIPPHRRWQAGAPGLSPRPWNGDFDVLKITFMTSRWQCWRSSLVFHLLSHSCCQVVSVLCSLNRSLSDSNRRRLSIYWYCGQICQITCLLSR